MVSRLQWSVSYKIPLPSRLDLALGCKATRTGPNEDRRSEIRRDINPPRTCFLRTRVIAQADYNNSVTLLNAMRRVFTARSCILATFFDGFHVAPCPELSRPPVDSGPCHDGTCSVRCRLPRAFSLHSGKDRSGNTRGMGTDFKVCIERQFGGIEGPLLNKIATSHRVCRGMYRHKRSMKARM